MSDQPDLVPAARFVGVGIGKYDQYPPLPAAPAQARQVADLLDGRGVQAAVLAATTEDGLRAELRQALPPGGAPWQLMVLWSGHGDRVADAPLRLVAQDTARALMALSVVTGRRTDARCGIADRGCRV